MSNESARKCPHCGEIKSLALFYRSKGRCKECKRIAANERRAGKRMSMYSEFPKHDDHPIPDAWKLWIGQPLKIKAKIGAMK